MIPIALANSFYAKDIPFAPSSVSSDYQAYSNVIRVDFAPSSVPRVQDRPLGVAEKLKWQTIATERLSALHRFSDGWDGIGSRAVSGVALVKADQILGFAFNGITSVAPPVAVPCGDGSLQLEWWLTDTRFELCIEPDGAMEGWALDRISGHEVVAEGTAAIELLSKWSGRLSADKLAQPA